ncbi:MAG: adenine nucleotide alpha hydrolase [Gammaproteobacteria bacterium]|nr:adenine nucleotide alpha hydrolase [Gammaproteobacteria bacterium]
MDTAQHNERALREWFDTVGTVAVAVSGGVDSMTLAIVAGRALGGDARMYHAVSPAVPAEASERVRRYAELEGWQLTIVDAGEFADPNYLANPVNRCFFCKQNLYATVAAHAAIQTVSGANKDDLGDYRPGLQAAAEHRVRHPYVALGMDKAAVRALAASLGLQDLADLPSAPCLSSRIETGIGIEAGMLGAVHRAERLLASEVGASGAGRSVRCRVRADAIVVELDDQALASLDAARRERLAARIAEDFARVGVHHPVAFEPYQRGSAFLHAREPSAAASLEAGASGARR